MKGHQVVELPSLGPIVSLNNLEPGMARSVLAWIAFSLSKKASEEDLGIRIDLITIQYISEYPALGIFYFSDLLEEIDDQEEWLIKEGEEMLADFSIIAFDNFLKEHRQSYISCLEGMNRN